MAVIKNKWIEKEKKKRVHTLTPAYESDPLSEAAMYNAKKPDKRHTNAARSTIIKTLRGNRK